MCKSAAMSGENNPFWGKVHDEETRARIRAGRRASPPKKRFGWPPGKSPSPEHKAKLAEALRKRWRDNREAMLAAVAHRKKEFRRESARYRRQFTPLQRREWKGTACIWCKSTEKLVLDHVVPVMCGGTNERKNAQTLCQPCNLWKMAYVDRPLFLAGLGSQGG